MGNSSNMQTRQLLFLVMFSMLFGTLVSQAQLTFPTVLMDEIGNKPMDGDTRKAVILIHGWNPPGLFSDTPKEDKFSDDEWFYLMNALKLELAGTDWKVVPYHWEKDAATGGILEFDGISNEGAANAVEAAANAFLHGQNLGGELNEKAQNLRFVHFIAHSAGSWVAREAAKRLLQLNPYVVVQITLLDPFIPDAITGNTPQLSKTSMNEIVSVSGNQRIVSLENYFSVDFLTDYFGSFLTRASSQIFDWGERGNNLQVAWGGYALQFTIYNSHSGPIEFYADSVVAKYPKRLDYTRFFGPDYNMASYGWNRSLFKTQLYLPFIFQQPSLPASSAQGQAVTVEVKAVGNANYLWFKDGVSTGITTASFRLLGISQEEGDYVVKVSNNNGHVYSDVVKFRLDTSAPKPIVEFVSPRSFTGKPVNQKETVTIKGSGFQPTSTLMFYEGGIQRPPISSPRYINANEIKYDLGTGPSAGEWEVVVINGDKESDRFKFWVLAAADATAPSAPISLHTTSSDWTKTGQVQLDWTNPADASGIAKAWVKVGNAPTTSGDGVAFPVPANKPLLVNVPLTSGAKMVHVWLEDGLGNRNSGNRASLLLGADSKAPIVRVLSPTPNFSNTAQSSVVISGDYSDELSGVEEIKWSATSTSNGSATLNGNLVSGTWTTPTINLQPGLNIIGITILDKAGNTSYAFVHLTRTTVDNSGSLTVNVQPGNALGAEWRFLGESTWRMPGLLVSQLPAGSRVVEFKPIDGFSTPQPIGLVIEAGQNAQVTGVYGSGTVIQAPDKPANPYPPNNAVNVPRNGFTLSWTGGHPTGSPDFAVKLGTVNPPGFAAGFGQVVNRQYTPGEPLLPGTTYYWVVWSRVGDKITEGDVWRFTTEHSYADLVPSHIEVDGSIQPGANVTVRVKVKNQGTFASETCWLNLYLSGSPEGRERKISEHNSMEVPVLAPGAEVELQQTVTLAGLSAGQSFIDAWVDSASLGRSESDFENNTQSLAINYVDGKAPEVATLYLQSASVLSGRSSTILYVASDDVGIRSMDFYWSTNSGATWEVIAEGVVPPGVPSSGLTHGWTVPASIKTGAVMVIQAIARDASGNWHAKSSVSYTVGNGTAPQVRVISPNGGESFQSGGSLPVQWTVSAPVGIDLMYVSLADGIYGLENADVRNNKSGIHTFTVSALIATSNTKARIWMRDMNGTVVEDFSDGAFSIRDSSFPPSPWEKPIAIGVPLAGQTDGGFFMPSIAVDSSSNVHVVYVKRASSTSSRKICYRKRSGSTWSSEVVLADVPDNIDRLKIAVDPLNQAHVIWSVMSDAGLPQRNDSAVFVSSQSGVSWGTPYNLSASFPQQLSIEPDIAVDSLGGLHAVWREGRRYESNGSGGYTAVGVAEIAYSFKSAGGSWSTPVIMSSETSGTPTLFVRQATDFEIVHTKGNKELARLIKNTDGLTEVLIPDVLKEYFVLDKPSNSDLRVGWSNFNEQTGKISLFTKTLNGGTWGAAQLIGTGGFAMLDCVGEGAFGYSHAIWYGNTNGIGKLYHSVNKGTGWTAPVQINMNSITPLAFSSAAAMAPNGASAHSVWATSTNGTYALYYADADLDRSSDVYAPTVTGVTPSVGAAIEKGVPLNIQWSAADDVAIAGITLTYTTNNGATWKPIASGLQNAGSYSWSMPNFGNALIQIKVSAADQAGNVGIGYSGVFTLIDSTPPSIGISKPSFGTTLTGNQVVAIEWSATDNVGVVGTSVEYSLDSGSIWTYLTNSTFSSGSLNWAVPNMIGGSVMLRGRAMDSSGLQSVSIFGPFQIARENSPPYVVNAPFPLLSTSGVAYSSPILQWLGGDIDGQQVSYYVRLGTNTANWLTFATTNISFIPHALRPKTTYFWQVLVTDGISTNSSPVWSFTTEDGQRAPVALPIFQRDQDGAFRLSVDGAFGDVHFLQVSSDLINWANLITFTNLGVSTDLIDAAAAQHPRRFYRVISP